LSASISLILLMSQHLQGGLAARVLVEWE